ncbi:MAG: hypothetical protein LBB38_02570, partial [Puniceicoccales bacterium]|nr:hypothetical protein [Puniceicoccales bacterium]
MGDRQSKFHKFFSAPLESVEPALFWLLFQLWKQTFAQSIGVGFMKKFIAVVLVFFAPLATGMAISLELSTRNEGEHVVNGSKFGQGKQEFSLGITGKLPKGYLSIGMDTRLMEGWRGCNKVAPRISYIVGVKDLFAIDFGYQSCFYFRNGDAKSPCNELHLSARVGGDFFVEWSTNYSFEEKELNLWLSTSMMSDLLIFDVSGSIAMRSSITIGYDHCNRPGGIPNFFEAYSPGGRPGYFYCSWGGDLVLKRSSAHYSYAGIRWAGNTASKSNWNNCI